MKTIPSTKLTKLTISAPRNFWDNSPNSMEAVFTPLEDIEIGDSFTLEEVKGETQKYVIYKKQIVSADDFAILQGTPGQATVALMTCHPVGIGTNRLIAIGRRVE